MDVRWLSRLLGLGWAALLWAGCASAPAVTPTPTTAATPRPLSTALADLQAEFQALPTGEREAGRQAFTSSGCSACHALEPEKRIVGPSLAGVGGQAGEREAGLSAELYLYKAITRPDAFVVAGFTPGLMPGTFIETLPPQTLADLLAFLLSLQ